MQPHREEKEHSRAHQALGQGLRDVWKVQDLPSKGGAHLTAVGEKAMRTSRVTALLTFRSSLFTPASHRCCPSCSSLGDKGAVGQLDTGTEPTNPATATPAST